MTEGPFDGSDLPPQDLVPDAGAPPAGGGGGIGDVGGADQPLDQRERTARPNPDHHVDEWPDTGVKPALGGLMI